MSEHGDPDCAWAQEGLAAWRGREAYMYLMGRGLQGDPPSCLPQTTSTPMMGRSTTIPSILVCLQWWGPLCPRPKASLTPGGHRRLPEGGEPLSCRAGRGTVPQEACQLLSPSSPVKFACKNNVSALFSTDRNPTDNWEERKMQTLKSAVSWVRFSDCLINAPSTDRCCIINT